MHHHAFVSRGHRGSLRSSCLVAIAFVLAGIGASTAASAPVITAVHGCTDDSSTGRTLNCPAAGNVPITIQGSDFGALGSHAYVGGVECPVTDGSDQQAICTLPPGSGKAVFVRVSDEAGSSSVDSPLLSYAPPAITSVGGCTNTPDASSTYDCARTGGEPLTIYGTGFGPAGSSKTVTVGGEVCPTSDDLGDNGVVCTLPPGTGTEKRILLISANQLSVGAAYTMSYAQCPPGTKVGAGGTCSPCAAGEFSSHSDDPACEVCPEGTSSEQGSSECTGASHYQCWQAKDVSATRFVQTEDLSVSDEILAGGKIDLKKFALYCTATGDASAGTPPPDLHQCCYQAKGAKLTVPVALATDDQGVSRSIEVTQPKMYCGKCDHL